MPRADAYGLHGLLEKHLREGTAVACILSPATQHEEIIKIQEIIERNTFLKRLKTLFLTSTVIRGAGHSY